MSRYNLYRIMSNTPGDIAPHLQKIGSDPAGIKLMAPKADQWLVHIDNLSLKAANILKQEVLSRGGDVALHRDIAGLSIDKTSALLIATKKQLRELRVKLKVQPFGLKTLGKELDELMRAFDRKNNRIFEMTLPHGAAPLVFGKHTPIMGILNVTPDSFSDGGQYVNVDEAVRHAKQMIDAGADIIDLGGESTRPGHVPISVDEELRRVLPIVQALVKEIRVPISVDTYKAEVAQKAILAGAHMINDIWGAKADPNMAAVAAQTGAPIILMHNRERDQYNDLIPDIIRELRESIDIALKAGCREEQLIVDPGFGFAKDYEAHLQLMNELEVLQSLGYPILLGTSRKRFIGTTLDAPVDQREEGTIATAVIGVQKGVDIVRVHHVEAVSRAVRMTDAIVRRGRQNG